MVLERTVLHELVQDGVASIHITAADFFDFIRSGRPPHRLQRQYRPVQRHPPSANFDGVPYGPILNCL